MSEEEISLKEAITQYETQLSQIQFAITASSPGTNLDNLILLKDDIEELINLTRENLATICSSNKPPISVPDAEDEDPFAKEYALFKAELASSEHSNAEEDDERDSSAALADIHSDLNELKGMKCQAPHSHQWGGSESYHNALVCSIEPSEDVSNVDQIKIRVMFTNPTHQEMLPCPYFLEGECRFDDDQCRFSHGEVVNLSSLKEYREPDFSVIRIGARVLVKNKDKLWHRAIVSAMHPDSRCEVKLEASRGSIEVDLHDLLPMKAETDGTDSQSSSSCDDLSEDEDDIKAMLVEQSLLVTPLSSALGSWEEHTKGIGSRLMAQMGYVTGAGLGKYGDGRIEPIEAVVLPAGKSLDHCMALREQAGGDKNLFKVERRMRRIQRKQKIGREKKFANEKRNAKTDVFDFINITLSGKEPESSPCSTKSSGKIGSAAGSTSLKTETQRELNLVGFQVGEDIRRAELDLAKLRQSLSRHSQGSAVHKTVAAKLNEKESELSQLRANERSIDQERSQRTDRKKLSVF